MDREKALQEITEHAQQANSFWDLLDEEYEIRETSETGGEKGVKLERPDLIPILPLRLLAKLYGVGALKYDDNNWRKGYQWSRSLAALERHLNKFKSGDDIDYETGVPHLVNVIWHAMALVEMHEQFPQYDDIYNRRSNLR